MTNKIQKVDLQTLSDRYAAAGWRTSSPIAGVLVVSRSVKDICKDTTTTTMPAVKSTQTVDSKPNNATELYG